MFLRSSHALTGMHSLWMLIKRNYPVPSRMAHFCCSAPPPPHPGRVLGNKWTDSVGNPDWILLTRSWVNRSSPSSVPPQTVLEPAAQIRRVCVLTARSLTSPAPLPQSAPSAHEHVLQHLQQRHNPDIDPLRQLYSYRFKSDSFVLLLDIYI